MAAQTALRQVQLEMLRNNARRHPYYEASFIPSGAWTKLEGKQVAPPLFDLTGSCAIPELRQVKRLPTPQNRKSGWLPDGLNEVYARWRERRGRGAPLLFIALHITLLLLYSAYGI